MLVNNCKLEWQKTNTWIIFSISVSNFSYLKESFFRKNYDSFIIHQHISHFGENPISCTTLFIMSHKEFKLEPSFCHIKAALSAFSSSLYVFGMLSYISSIYTHQYTSGYKLLTSRSISILIFCTTLALFYHHWLKLMEKLPKEWIIYFLPINGTSRQRKWTIIDFSWAHKTVTTQFTFGQDSSTLCPYYAVWSSLS